MSSVISNQVYELVKYFCYKFKIDTKYITSMDFRQAKNILQKVTLEKAKLVIDRISEDEYFGVDGVKPIKYLYQVLQKLREFDIEEKDEEWVWVDGVLHDKKECKKEGDKWLLK